VSNRLIGVAYANFEITDVFLVLIIVPPHD